MGKRLERYAVKNIDTIQVGTELDVILRSGVVLHGYLMGISKLDVTIVDFSGAKHSIPKAPIRELIIDKASDY